jgi:MAF protein
LDEVIPIDMFPQTQHVECVAALSLKKTLTKVILASSSPRRRELLIRLGVDFEVYSPGIEECILAKESPQEMVLRLAEAKARVVAERLPSELVLGADTAVIVDGCVLGKPKSSSEASEMLDRLRNREHQVVTGAVLLDGDSQTTFSGLSSSLVFIRDFSDLERDAYIDCGQGMDKAGGYGIQDKPFNPVERIEGSYTNIVGLPLALVTDLFIRAGYNTSELSSSDEL